MGWKRLRFPVARSSPRRPGRWKPAPFISFSAFRQNQPAKRLGRSSDRGCSALHRAALLPHFGNLRGQLIVEVVRGAWDVAIADQIERRALQPELLGKVLGLVERLLHFGA